MKSHLNIKRLILILLLLIAGVAFAVRFIVSEKYVILFDIVAFVLPTTVAIFEIVLTGPASKVISQMKYEELEKQGKIDRDTIYFTHEDD